MVTTGPTLFEAPSVDANNTFTRVSQLYSDLSAVVTLHVVDNDAVGIVFAGGDGLFGNELNGMPNGYALREGLSGELLVRLNSHPLDTVTISVRSLTGARLQLTAAAAAASDSIVTLTFTPQTWSLSQSVSVTATDNTDVESPQWVHVAVSVTGAGADPYYASLTPLSVTFLIADNDIDSLLQVSSSLRNITEWGDRYGLCAT